MKHTNELFYVEDVNTVGITIAGQYTVYHTPEEPSTVLRGK